LTRELTNSGDREQRFSSLLALAADTTWEIDHNYRLVSVNLNKPAPHSFGIKDGLGEVPWDLPQFASDATTLDDLLADLDARQPFHERNLGWATQKDGRLQLRELLVSGEPRFDGRGVFIGYWGVSRDVTAVRAAQRSLVDTETRYQELFARIPTPLVLHRDHRVSEANPAAAQMFGFASPHDMVGSDLLAAFDGQGSRERAQQRAAQLQHQPIGTALPVADFSLRVDGRPLAVRATDVRVQNQGGAALLSIFVDDTERLATEDAVRRSEAMLSHLVATSPDLILLIEAATGRFAMVNQAFELRCGHHADQAVGHTAQELGLWADAAHAELLLHQVTTDGSVSDRPLMLRTKDGTALPVRVSAARFVMDRRDYLVLNARDISESEHARMERETILTHASIGIAVTRGQRFVLANPHFESMFGWEPQQLLGQAEAVLWPSAEAHDEIKRRYAGTLESGQPVNFDAQARKRDGSLITAHVRARAIDPERPLQAGTAWIVEDVTERRAFEQTLARARDAAEAASRAKSAFLANTSHELRTPLNGLIGLARLARDPTIAEPKRLEYLEQISGSADALATIITDILDVSKIEAGKLLLEPTVFDLGKLLLTLQNAFAPTAQASHLSLHFDVDPSAMGCVSGDPLRVRQIVSNFVTNALKFTAQGQVRVRVQRQGKPGAPSAPGDVVRIEVHDTGPGIAAHIQTQLFKPFSQADQSNTRRFGGTGLGLSINRELATLMGGQVGVESGLGQGSIFWAELPLPMRQPPVVHQPVVKDSSLQGMQVLMVEDNPVNMLIGVAMLERWGVQVTQAGNGRDALLALNLATQMGRRFDAVLMDIQMPVMSGHEATREMRKLEAGRKLPIIALTAAALVNEREEALRSGMNDFLTKPVDSEKLRSTLLRCCALAADAP
jgi:PAS domain S-box-containing protein